MFQLKFNKTIESVERRRERLAPEESVEGLITQTTIHQTLKHPELVGKDAFRVALLDKHNQTRSKQHRK